MKITKQYLKKLIIEELTQEMSAPAPMQEAAGNVVYLVGLDIPYESPMIYGAFSDKQKALKAIETLKQDEDSMDNQAIWTIEVNDKLMADDIMFGNSEKV
jgi:hypothetical protein